jgi:hemoglobin-like flavoprotein
MFIYLPLSTVYSLQGMRHSMLNLPGVHFDVLGGEVLKGLRLVLGDKLTPEAEHSWGLVYTILSEMLQGRMKKYNKDIGYNILNEE